MKKLVSAVLVFLMVLTVSTAAFAEYGIVVTSNPKSETHLAGETACFSADANFYSMVDWSFITPSGMEFSAQEFRSMFPEVYVDGENTTLLTLRNLSPELNEWAVVCNFHNSIDNAHTSWAFLYVSPTYGGPVY